MHTFTDDTGQTWTLAINLAAIKRVRSHCRIDLLKLHEGAPPVADGLIDDPILVCEVIYALLMSQAFEREISLEAFEQRMGPAEMGTAIACFWEEITDFFQAFEASTRAATDRQPQSTLGKSCTDLPASPDKIPTRSPSAS